MAYSKMNTKDFFAEGKPNQFEWVLTQYDTALRAKAESKSSKPENVIKLDKWYQNELPKKIKSRGKDAHLVHDELVQTIKWKLARGKFRPNLVNLVQMNTPRVVQQETKKAFRNIQKKSDLQSACNALCNLKGVGPAMASAVLAAGAPQMAPFMADECLLAMPDVDSLDYTMKEYMRFVEYVKACVDRLNGDGGTSWTPHRVELAVWTHYILRDLKPEVLTDMPGGESSATTTPTKSAAAPVAEEPVSAAKPESAASPPANNGQLNDEDTKSSMDSETAEHQPVVTSEEQAKNHTAEAEKQPSSEAEVVAAAAVPAATEAPQTEAAPTNGNSEAAATEAVATTTDTPKTNGNNSHSSNGSSEQKNGQEEHPKEEAKVEKTEGASNGELENGVNSSEKESTTDLSSSSPPSTKRPIESGDASSEDTNEPSAKKLKACEGADNSTDASEATAPPPVAAAPPSGPPEEAPPQVAV